MPVCKVGLGFVGKIGFKYSATEVFEYSNPVFQARRCISFTVLREKFPHYTNSSRGIFLFLNLVQIMSDIVRCYVIKYKSQV